MIALVALHSSAMTSTSRDSASDQRPAYVDSRKPLFAARQRAQRPFNGQPSGSRETSFSPPLPSEGNDRLYPSRRVHGGPRTLTEAFAASANDEGVSHRRSPSPMTDRSNGRSYIPKPGPLDSSRRNSPSPPKASGSPSRLPVASTRGNGSAKSYSPNPPKRLHETYGRVTEENTRPQPPVTVSVASDDDEQTGNFMTYHYTYADRSRDKDHIRVGKRSDSPASFTRTRGSSPSPELESEGSETADMDEVGQDDTAASRSGSEISGLSILEDGTSDSFNQRLIRHARDQERILGARKTSGLFSRARTGDRAGSEPDSLGRRRASAGEHVREGSVSSQGSDPPMNIPNTWGSKARMRKHWLSNINNSDSREGPDANSEELRSRGPDWGSETADAPIPSVEDTLPPETDRPMLPLSPPRSTAIDRLRSWEDDEFTARSLQVSTSPPIKAKRNNALDDVRTREIESLKNRAVTTNRLGEITKRASRESLNKEGKEMEESAEGNVEAIRTPIRSHRSGSLRRRLLKAESSEAEAILPTTYEDEGDAIPNTPIVIFRGSQNGPTPKMDGDQENHVPSEPESLQRPRTERADSQDILRELARATSSSLDVSPNDRDLKPPVGTEDASPASGGLLIKDGPSDKGNETLELIASIDQAYVPETPATKEETSDSKTPVQDPLTQPTPMVTGAWIPTPAAFSRRDTAEGGLFNLGLRDFILGPKSSPSKENGGPPSKEPSNIEQTPKAMIKATTTNEQKRRISQDDDITIDSIQELLLVDASLTSLDEDTSIIDIPLPTTDASGRALSEQELERLREARAYEQMAKRLRKLHTGIHDAKRGIETLEQNVEQQPVIVKVVYVEKPWYYEGPTGVVLKKLWWERRFTRLGWIVFTVLFVWWLERVAW